MLWPASGITLRRKLDKYASIYFLICMHRTTILLPESLKRDAERRARREGLSLSELIRRRLAEDVDEREQRPAFFEREPWSGPVTDDLASRHDDYLYEKG